ncbi:MAG: hypothetical protein WBO97_13435 [Tepidiformaceae bacterium]
MTTITVSVDEELYERVRSLADACDSAPEDLVRVYLEYLAAGGLPIPNEDDPSLADIAALVAKSSAWAWLADEPDLYTLEDGEPYIRAK